MDNTYKEFVNSIRSGIRRRSLTAWFAVKGFSETEVTEVETKFGKKLPLAYKEFLLVMGHNSGGLFGDTIFTFDSANSLLELRTIAEEHWSELGFNNILSNDSFLFACYGGTFFSYFNCTDLQHDPEVFDYEAGFTDKPICKGKFTEVLEYYYKNYIGKFQR